MARPDVTRIAGVALLTATLLLPPVAARAFAADAIVAVEQTDAAVDLTAADAAAVDVDAAGEAIPVPRSMAPTVSVYRISAIAIGTVAGAIVGNLLTSGLMTPVLTGGLAGPGIAAATGGAYAVSAITTTFFAGIGAYLGSWASGPAK